MLPETSGVDPHALNPTSTVAYLQVSADDQYFPWLRRGWELVGLHWQGRGQGEPELVAVLRHEG